MALPVLLANAARMAPGLVTRLGSALGRTLPTSAKEAGSAIAALISREPLAAIVVASEMSNVLGDADFDAFSDAIKELVPGSDHVVDKINEIQQQKRELLHERTGDGDADTVYGTDISDVSVSMASLVEARRVVKKGIEVFGSLDRFEAAFEALHQVSPNAFAIYKMDKASR